jgi:hypothetical protein
VYLKQLHGSMQHLFIRHCSSAAPQMLGDAGIEPRNVATSCDFGIGSQTLLQLTRSHPYFLCSTTKNKTRFFLFSTRYNNIFVCLARTLYTECTVPYPVPNKAKNSCHLDSFLPCWGSGSVSSGSACYWASRIRIH